ncbi:inactive tyrosine-protein kinase 7a isoform X2 [Clupea harengus]|uniref:Inactive tyrosine-protein kinase 7 n=1 Tax=Clupea harengus TaxID=7950 RepID=A0A6P8F7Q2_CLUHA|nr:inactive tyrosine-protein kinase 7a isoform X2 [Clupea harengus]
MTLSLEDKQQPRRLKLVLNRPPYERVPLSTKGATVFAILALLSEVLCAHANLQFSEGPKSQDALHGRSAMLRCEASSPEEVAYTWLQNGVAVNNTERRYQEGGNLKFTAVDRTLDSGNFQCVALVNATGEQTHSNNASFNIKWLESGAVTLQEPASETDIESAAVVTLRCNIDGHPRPTCRWYRDGVHLTERDKIHRINSKERTLTLPSVTPDNNGVYYCCAKNPAGHACSSLNFTLNIIDKSYPQPVVSPEDQVVLKNEEAMFHCQFTADPPPTVVWYHEDEPIANKSRVFLMGNGSLFITQVKPRNTGVYKCVGKGPQGQAVTLEASLRLAELEDTTGSMSRIFAADSLERVSCRPPRGHPEPQVWWEREGKRLPSKGRVHQDGLDLVFSPTEGDDSGLFTCVAQNKAATRKQELTVTVATPPVWVQKPEKSELREGQAGYLHCHAKASPEPEVTWYRNHAPIDDEDVRFKQFPNGTLRINSVEVYDKHIQYSCMIRNEAGRLTAHASVLILERLKFTPTPQSTQCLELDKEGSLQCSARGQETPTVQWIKSDGSEIPPLVTRNGGTLHFSKVMQADAGNYTCVASNSLQGEIRAEVEVTVAEYVSFKLEPENTTVYQGHTAVLHCQASGDPAPYIQWKKKDARAIRSRYQTMPNGSLVIHDVSVEDTGSYICIAGNKCNIGHTSAELYVVEKPVQHSLEVERTPYKMIQTIGLSVGAAVAYIIVVLGLMLYCKRRRNAKRLQKGTAEGEEPEMECLNGGATVQQNGQTTAEIQEEVALTNMATTGNANKRHSSHDKLHFPRANLTNITTLGKGEFGEVFLAKVKLSEDDEEEAVVLVKSLQTRDEQLQQEFRREAEMFSKLCHANITRIVGMCREVDPYYMVLEYADMGDLKQFLKNSKCKDEKVKLLSTKQKVSVCLQVAKGMEHLSNGRFVHKDLAARNCLISSKRHVKISALCLSKDVYHGEYHQYRQARVPLRWLPAEAVFEDDYSTKTDVWAFAVLVWEVFSFGELPYAPLDDDKVLEGLREAKLKLTPPHGCPSRVYKLMMRCWAPSPKDRVSFSDIVAALSELPSESKV